MNVRPLAQQRQIIQVAGISGGAGPKVIGI
jgi:hypothetical protein